jgi:hypothetical protein
MLSLIQDAAVNILRTFVCLISWLVFSSLMGEYPDTSFACIGEFGAEGRGLGGKTANQAGQI